MGENGGGRPRDAVGVADSGPGAGEGHSAPRPRATLHAASHGGQRRQVL